jgi:hypothetical protein
MVEESIEKRFATIAMKKGFITLNQFAEVMRIQVMEDVTGVKHRLVGEILLELGYMRASEIQEVLNEMGLSKL